MTETDRNVATAVALMRMALALLDRAGRHGAACRLQHAIDIADHVPVPETVEEADAQLDTPQARAVLDRLWSDGEQPGCR